MSRTLDKYRQGVRQERKAQRPTIETVEGKPYKAFESATHAQRRLDLRAGYDAQRIVSYGYLTDIVHAAGRIIGLSISVPQLSIEIKGRNLQELVDLLREERVTAIQEHITEWHEKPGLGQPVVESLQIIEPGKRSKSAPRKH